MVDWHPGTAELQLGMLGTEAELELGAPRSGGYGIF
jgi:hypothetical protein